MKSSITILLWCATVLLTSLKSSGQALGNIDCGGGNHTCFRQVISEQGAARCTCTADCLSPCSITPDVGSSTGAEWSGCTVPITVRMEGSTTAPNTYAETGVTTHGLITGSVRGVTESRETVDCFLGTIDDDPPLSFLCD